MSVRRLALLAAALLAAAGNAYAGASGVTGTVTAGPRSEPIANARVVLSGGGRSTVAMTDDQGRYEIASLEPGVRYDVAVEADGLRPASGLDVLVHDGEMRRLDFNLELADLRYAVAVAGSAEDAGTSGPVIGRAVTVRDVEA